ncbi:GTP cyclohydrolase 1 type 2 [Tepiditoga spiralis]|uniref:GTP cyclohydrolase 1 type 2 n=1 Tax=Tepiditoga spiralis TaxID=2108365 RepID=A0A7G1G7T8_9BACT|nr:Nif3-like dinuclear metal center hexameric protein [Tepiditoga spiralis]BBE31264.1 GTP cyclohydrolase 1 type 2 [Tepiditoga spiralis]
MNIFEAENYLNKILKVETFNDFCHNGIQIEGTHEVKKIAIGVSFNEEFLNEAIKQNCQMMLVHHGIFGKNFFKLTGFQKKRIEKVIKNDMTLMGYHLPLDSHEEYGNNISILKKLNLLNPVPFNFGFIGNYEEKISFEEFKNNLKKVFENQELKIYKNNDFVKKVCIISGDSANTIELLENKVDTFISGETKEYSKAYAQELKINFINAGHYSTETFGVKNLAKLLEEKFNVKTVFIDIYNEI